MERKESLRILDGGYGGRCPSRCKPTLHPPLDPEGGEPRSTEGLSRGVRGRRDTPRAALPRYCGAQVETPAPTIELSRFATTAVEPVPGEYFVTVPSVKR